MASALFALIFLLVLFIINQLKVEYTFFILFFLHLLSGSIVDKYGISIAGISATGLINFLALSMLVVNLPNLLKMKESLKHTLLLYSSILFLFYAIPLFYNFNSNSFTRFISNFGSFISIYYLGQISFHKIANFEDKFIGLLKYFFIFSAVAGFLNALSLGFNFENSRGHIFSFYFFEYPHSFSIFASSLIPLFLFYIYNGQLKKYYYLLVLFFMPLALLYCGAKIGMIVYGVTLTCTVLLTFRQKISNYLISALVLVAGIYFFINTPIFEDLKDVFSVPLENYLFDTSNYSFNTLHSRTKVWAFMFFNLIQEDNLFLGFGWRSWSMKYLFLSGGVSSQSDYFTILFELGLVGLLGFILFRILLIYHLLKNGRNNVKAYYLAIGIVCSLFIGGLTENVEGYPSTSWLIPFFLALNHYFDQKDKNLC